MESDNLKTAKTSFQRSVSASSSNVDRTTLQKQAKRKPEELTYELAPANSASVVKGPLVTPDESRTKKQRTSVGIGEEGLFQPVKSHLSASNPSLQYTEIFGPHEVVAGFDKTLDQLRAEVCAQGLPFIFAIDHEKGAEREQFGKVFPWAGAYLNMLRSTSRSRPRRLRYITSSAKNLAFLHSAALTMSAKKHTHY